MKKVILSCLLCIMTIIASSCVMKPIRGVESASASETIRNSPSRTPTPQVTVTPEVTPKVTTSATPEPTAVPPISVNVEAGDYVSFGSYYGDPILWKAASMNENGLMLVSEYILCMKSFSANGQYFWSTSNIRDWLNSSSAAVFYSTFAPLKENVDYNAYADEPGFLTNFTAEERYAIAEVQHDGVTDLVYLLSEDESKAERHQITQKAIEASEYKYGFSGNYYWGYATRTKSQRYINAIRFVKKEGYIEDTLVTYGFIGVLPALNLKSDIAVSGKGTIDDPYIMAPVPVAAVTPVPAPTPKICADVGDYVKFGTYLGDPILWKVFDNGSDGVVLISEYILCQKPYAASNSNIWSNSNIREWLNSADQKVHFTTLAPSKEVLYLGYNAYEEEPGFLTNFTEQERNGIQAISHDGVTDLVYLLSQNEIGQYMTMNSDTGNPSSISRRQMTQKGRDAADKKWLGDAYWLYCTRTPSPAASMILMCVNPDGSIGDTGNASFPNLGILPALNLKSGVFASGSGTVADPYVMSAN